MKVAVSIPDMIFGEAEQLAKRLNTSRSDIYARALHTFVGAYEPDRVTAAIDTVVAAVEAEEKDFARAAARKAFGHTEW